MILLNVSQEFNRQSKIMHTILMRFLSDYGQFQNRLRQVDGNLDRDIDSSLYS